MQPKMHAKMGIKCIHHTPKLKSLLVLKQRHILNQRMNAKIEEEREATKKSIESKDHSNHKNAQVSKGT